MNENVKRRLRKRIPKSEETTESTQEEISEEQQPNDHQLAHECSLCDKVYSRHYRLKQHERQVHSIHVGRQCTVCMEVVGYDPLWREKKKLVIGDKKTVSKEDLEEIDKLLEYTITDTTGQRHQIIFSSTGQASHQCTVCFKIFSRCWDSQHHQSQEHSETDVHAEIGYQCKMCSQLFKTPKTLKRHSSLNCVALSQNMSEIVAMKYRCEWCYRLMESEKSLKSHIDTHRALIRRLSKNQQTTETATSTITKPSTLSSSESSSLASCSRVPAAAATTRTSEI